MAKAHPIFTNFTAGEVSPLLDGRVDLAKYFNACTKLENMLIHPHGPASNRSGFGYIAATKDSSKKSRLIPFEFSTVQAYILEFGHEYIRFYMDQGQIMGNGSPYEIASPYQESELFELKYAQSADVMWIVHPNHKPRKLSRTGHTNWTLTEVEFIDGPYEASSGEEQATLGSDLVTNGDFDPDTNWTKGTGWSISGGKAVGAAGSESDIYQSISITQDEDYEVVFTLSDRTDGTITPKVGSTEGLPRNKNGTYTERITCGGGAANIAFEKSAAFAGKIDDVSVKKVNYNNENNLKPNGVTGSITITADLNTFAATDVDRLLRWQADDANWYWFKITAYTDEKNVTATVKSNDLPNINKSGPFRLGTWCEELGYPSCTGFYEERLGFAGSTAYPQTIWLSQSIDFENMITESGDADAIKITIAADQVNAIRWMSPGKRLILGTTGGEWNLGSSASDEVLAPTNIRVKQETAHGSANIQPARIGHLVLFLQKALRKIRELTYSFEVNNYVAPDMTLLAEHITESGITDMAYQQEPLSILFCVRKDGVLLGLTYQREQEVVGWHRHITGGAFESVATIPGSGEDELWVIVKRTINGATKRYVELLDPLFTGTDTIGAFFVDSGLSYDGGEKKDITGATQANPVVITAVAHGFENTDKTRIKNVGGMTELNHKVYTVANKTADTYELSGVDGTGYGAYTSGGTTQKVTNTVSGLDHLEAKEVAILADGATHPNKTVASGSVTLERYANQIHAGLPYSAILRTMKLEAGVIEGTAQGRIKRISKVVVRLFKTLGCKIGPDEDNLDTVYFRDSSMPMDAPPDLFTGDKDIDFPEGYETDAHITIVQDQPLPITVVAIMPKIQTSDE